MADLLSAASVFLATLGLLYSAWYEQIRSAASTRTERFEEDRGPSIKLVKSALYGRAIPLAASSTVLVLILCPPFWSVCQDAWQALFGNAVTGYQYDPLRALFLAVFFLTTGLTIHLARSAMRLYTKLGELERPKSTLHSR